MKARIEWPDASWTHSVPISGKAAVMGTGDSTQGLKREAVAQIGTGLSGEGGFGRLGVGTRSICAWNRKFAKAVSGENRKDAETRRPERELACVVEEHDIL